MGHSRDKVDAMSKLEPTVDLGYPTPAYGRIPSFANIEEEAEFWDTHDTADFADELVPVEVTIGLGLTKRSPVGLQHADRTENQESDVELEG